MAPGEEPREPTASANLQLLLALVDQLERERGITWVGDRLTSGDSPGNPAAPLCWEGSPRAGPLVVTAWQRSGAC